MAKVPVISSPCPFRWNRAPAPGQDFCGQCQRQVHNLDLMSNEQRVEFIQSCKGEVCVSYTARRPTLVKNVALGLGLAAGMLSSNLSAEDDTKGLRQIESKLQDSITEWENKEALETKELDVIVLLGGTILDPETSRWVDDTEVEISEVKDLPVSTEMEWMKTPEK